MRASLGDQPITGDGVGPAAGGGGPKPGFTPERRTDRAQRPVLVRLGREVQEVSRALSPAPRRSPEPATLKPRSLLRDLLKVGLLACLAIALVAGYATFRVWAQGERDERRPADAIVVMGAAQYDGRPSPLFAARLDHAVELYHAGIAPRLVLTGGKADGDRTTEAASARAYAIAPRRPGRGHPDGREQPDDARVDPCRRGAAARERSR